MKGFEAYKSIFHYYNEHGSHENLVYIFNMHLIYFISSQSFMNILHGYKLVQLPYPRSFLCEEATIKQHSFSKKELCEISDEAIWESRFTCFLLLCS